MRPAWADRAKTVAFFPESAFGPTCGVCGKGALEQVAVDAPIAGPGPRIERSLLAGLLPLAGHVLCVSGRLAFELVQKAAVAGAPILVASAPRAPSRSIWPPIVA